MKNNSHDALLEREHDSRRRMAGGGTNWLQDKKRIVLEMNGIHLRDYFLMDKFFWTKMISLQQNELPCHFQILNTSMQNKFFIKNSIRMNKNKWHSQSGGLF